MELWPNGSIDRRFGRDGQLNIGYRRAAVDRHGRILLVSSEAGSEGSWDASVTRLLPNGDLDTSFGDGGTTAVDFGRRLDSGTAVHVQPNGKILVGGTSASFSSPRGGSDGVPVLARLLSDGKRDWTFGRKGVLTLGGRTPLEEEDIESFANGPHGSTFVVAGSGSHLEIVRLEGSGRVDRSFGHGGAIVVGGFAEKAGVEFFQPIPKVGALPGGRIVVVGTASDYVNNRSLYWLMAIGFRADGRLDHSFGDGGYASAHFSREAFASAFVARKDGTVIMAGSVHPAAERSEMALAALRPNGALDGRFGRRGRIRLSFAGWTMTQGLILQRQGRAVVVGLAQDTTPPYVSNRTVLARVPLVRHRVR